MTIQEIINQLEALAPPALQEEYDNAGLITGDPSRPCTGVLLALDVTEEVLAEAIDRGCNLIVTHHPIVFSGLKKITGRNLVERCVIRAIRADLALYAIHTNLDNVLEGVNGKLADLLGLGNRRVLQPLPGTLRKLVFFVPPAFADKVRDALFQAGAGHIGRYAECSFGSEGTGTFKAGDGARPFVGERGIRHEEPEWRIEMIYPSLKEAGIVKALKEAHPYEEVAYYLHNLENTYNGLGAGLLGEWEAPLEESGFLALVRNRLQLPMIRHSARTGRPVRKIALCGGAGKFLINRALSEGVDAFITADLKYHDFFGADGRLLLCDIGHFESEQFTVDLLLDILQQKFPTFAVLKSGLRTNPVYYYL